MDNQSDLDILSLSDNEFQINSQKSSIGVPIFWVEDLPVVSPLFSPEKNRKRLAEANISEDQMKRELEELKFADEYWEKMNYAEEPLAV